MVFTVCFPVTVAAVAVIMDLRTGKVDNGWILFSMLLEFTVICFTEGAGGLLKAAGGVMLPLICVGPLFLFHMLGAGDIKLLSALGAIMGIEKIFSCLIYSFLCGGFIALAILLLNGDGLLRFRYLGEYVREFMETGKIKPYYKSGMEAPENFHFTIPVFMSVMLYAGGVY